MMAINHTTTGLTTLPQATTTTGVQTSAATQQAQLAQLAQLLQMLEAMQQQTTPTATQSGLTQSTLGQQTNALTSLSPTAGLTPTPATTSALATNPLTTATTPAPAAGTTNNFNVAMGSISSMLGSFFTNLGEGSNMGLVNSATQSALTPYVPMAGTAAATTGTSSLMTGLGTGTTTGLGTTSALGTTTGLGTTTALGSATGASSTLASMGLM